MPVNQVSNMDIAGLCDRVTMFANELIHSQSAFNGGLFLQSDRARLASYLDRLETFVAAVSQAPLDLPKIHNVGFSLLKSFPNDQQIEGVENQDVKDIIRRLKALWIDMSESQSADLSSGVNRFDVSRFTQVVESCRALLNLAGDAIDLPENLGNTPVPTAGAAASNRSTVGY